MRRAHHSAALQRWVALGGLRYLRRERVHSRCYDGEVRSLLTDSRIEPRDKRGRFRRLVIIHGMGSRSKSMPCGAKPFPDTHRVNLLEMILRIAPKRANSGKRVPVRVVAGRACPSEPILYQNE